ncbi:hypothetical protein AV654_30345 [Paenibacillus elgii]|uniref:Uncharacterized protein n=1 Tax=Paenibacillus elgii TaxID=189691 RepID=A0A163V3B2_9BACL|nr:hypothetical protein AV654_30345 [Paenibacillus elgii]
MGKSLDQAVEAIADAQTGELERLKEFGFEIVTMCRIGNGYGVSGGAVDYYQEMIRRSLNIYLWTL